MNDAVEVIQEEPVETPPATGLPESSLSNNADSDLDSLLAEFDAKTKQAEPAQAETPNAPTDGSGDELDALLRDLDTSSTQQQQIQQLTGELNSVRQAELDRQARADFEGWSQKLQAELGPNVDENFARTTLLALSVENPALEAAWQFRHLTNEQRRAADAEFRSLEVLYNQAQRAPNDPRKFEAMQQMERRGQELALMINSHKILTNAWRDVQKRASKVAPPVDELATADHDAVAFAVREMRSGDIPEPPVKLGQLTDAEFKEYTRKNFGF